MKNTTLLLITAAIIFSACGSSRQLPNQTVSSSVGPDQHYIPAGPFEMGASLKDDVAYANDVTKRTLQMSQFYMDVHEVTNDNWRMFVEEAGPEYLPDSTLMWSDGGAIKGKVIDYYNSSAFGNYPVVGITWEQANAYCEWRTIKEQALDPSIQPYRLPTEEEWEYAAISLHTLTTDITDENIAYAKTYPWYGDGLRYDHRLKDKEYHGSFLANFKAEHKGVPPTKEVRSYWPNDFYLFDMAGNVNEWVADQYRPFVVLEDGVDNSQSATEPNLYGVTSLVNEKSRVIKGGSWDDSPHWLIPASRRHFQQDQASSTIGFRTVRSTNDPGPSIRGRKTKKVGKGDPIPRLPI